MKTYFNDGNIICPNKGISDTDSIVYAIVYECHEFKKYLRLAIAQKKL